MNTHMRWFLCTCLLAVLLAGCCPGSSDLPEESMKGYELYTWQEDGQWFFSLLEGTNRLKTDEEILTAARFLNGSQDLQELLKRLAPGQFVTWTALEDFPLPDEGMVVQFEQACLDLELECSVIR